MHLMAKEEAMNLSQLYYFKKLAKLQHYTKAAKELYITQPTLSGSIAALEKELGVALFMKEGRNVQLTKYGVEFAKYVDSSLDQLDEGIAIMKDYAGASDGGNIDLGCIMTVQMDYIPKLLKGYYEAAHSHVNFDVMQKPSGPLTEDLLEGRFDVVFCARGDMHSDFAYVPVLAEEIIVAMSDFCPLVDKEFITPEDLKKEHIISYREKIPLGKSVKDFLSGEGILNVKYAYDDESILAGFAANGVNAALMCDTFLLSNAEGITLKTLYNNDKEKKRFYHRIYMVYSTKKYHPHCVDSFIEYVEANRLPENEGQIYID